MACGAPIALPRPMLRPPLTRTAAPVLCSVLCPVLNTELCLTLRTFPRLIVALPCARMHSRQQAMSQPRGHPPPQHNRQGGSDRQLSPTPGSHS